MRAELLVSLSGASESPSSWERGTAVAVELAERGVPLSQLFRPGPLGADPEGAGLASWMQERRAAGDAIVLHGYDHSRDPLGIRPRGPRALRRRAEFAALPRHEAMLRLTAARRVLTVAGLRCDVFVPPGWLASPGTVEALREQGFARFADETGIHDLRDGHVVRAPVLGFRAADLPDGGAAESWRAKALVSAVVRAARDGGLVRINIRDKDLRHPARRAAALAAIDAALALNAVPRTYTTPSSRRGGSADPVAGSAGRTDLVASARRG